jgi:hypothetical protein
VCVRTCFHPRMLATGLHVVMHACWLSVMQKHQEKVDDANEKLSSVHELHNKLENLKVKQQTLAKQNGESYARFVVRFYHDILLCRRLASSVPPSEIMLRIRIHR